MEYNDEIKKRMRGVMVEIERKFKEELAGCINKEEKKKLFTEYINNIGKANERAKFIWQGKKPWMLVEVIDAQRNLSQKINSIYQDIFNKNG